MVVVGATIVGVGVPIVGALVGAGVPAVVGIPDDTG